MSKSTEITLLCDHSSTDELGIRWTAEKLGIEIGLIPFHKSAFSFNKSNYEYWTMGKDYTNELKKTEVIINRCQSKNRRLIASSIIESINKPIINPQSIETVCYSKLRTLFKLASNGINVPKTVYVPFNAKEKTNTGKEIENTRGISELFINNLGEKFVIKPEAGSLGKGVRLVSGKKSVMESLSIVESNITNPIGIIGQEEISKWFFDLRILVSKKKGASSVCHSDALARGGFTDFRTNTYLGNMVFKVKLPNKVAREAKHCADVLSQNEEAWIIGLDAMPNIPNEMRHNENILRKHLDALKKPFSKVLNVKKTPDKKLRFNRYTEKINEAYYQYMNTEDYRFIESFINDILSQVSDEVYFHEGNACPDFWEQTRIVAGINLAEDIINCAESLI